MDPTYQPINYEALKFWLAALQALLTASVWLYVWVSNRNRVTTGRITTLEKSVDSRLDSHSDRLSRLESSIDHLPTHTDVQNLADRIGSAQASSERVAGEFSAVRRQVQLIHDHLMNGPRRQQ